MAHGVIHLFRGGTRSQYDASIEAAHGGRDELPEGQIFHAAGPTSEGWVIVAIHDTQASWERFRDGRLGPLMEQGIEGGLEGPPEETTFEVDNLISG